MFLGRYQAVAFGEVGCREMGATVTNKQNNLPVGLGTSQEADWHQTDCVLGSVVQGFGWPCSSIFNEKHINQIH